MISSTYCINQLLENGVLLVSKILLGYEEALWLKKIGDISCQSNFDKCSSDFGSFFSYLITVEIV